MNSKRLIIAFFIVSLAALAASGAAVISVARAYNNILTREKGAVTSAASPQTSEEASVTETQKAPEDSDSGVTENIEEDITVSLPEDITAEETTGNEASRCEVFTLIIDSDRLALLSPDGERIYERITDPARIHPKDLEALRQGICFGTREDAMSAVYDIIS